MDVNALKNLGEKVRMYKDQIETEEATKSAFVMPLIQLLGYDVFNPTEVVPEFVTDEGARNVEKVDYAIFLNKAPVFIIECKKHHENIHVDTLERSKHYTQLHKYFHLTNAKFAVLTNGIVYHFFTDIDLANKMDSKPFFSFDVTNIKENHISELKKFHKNDFNNELIKNAAAELKYLNSLKEELLTQLEKPDTDFVKFFITKVFGKVSKSELEKNELLIKNTFLQTVKDMISDKIMNAINQPKQVEKQEVENEIKNITTEEELNSFFIVKSILRSSVSNDRIFYKDTQNYFSIILDDKSNKPICRLWLNSKNKKYIGIFDKEKKETKFEINSLDDIYNYSEQLILTLSYYENEK